MGASRRRSRLVSALLLMAGSGCVTVQHSEVFWRSPGAGTAAPAEGQAVEAVTAEGRVVADRGRQWIAVVLSNRGTAPLRMSYVADEYIGRTGAGRTFEFEKGEFLTYPTSLDPGSEQSVILSPPRDVAVQEIAELAARINRGQTIVILQILGTVAAPASSPPGDAPVTVAFAQEFGTALKADVSWDDGREVVSLAHGEERPFALLPGRHVLRVRTEVPGIGRTEGHLPVTVTFHHPVRIRIMAHVHITGVELCIRILRDGQFVSEETVAPGAHD